MIALVVITIAAIAINSSMTTNYQATVRQRDRVFAFEVAQSLQSEVLALAQEEAVTGQNLIDPLDNGGVSVPELTTAKVGGVPVPPDHPSSRNYRRYGRWLWSRQIEVQSLSTVGNRKLRYVTVRVFRRQRDGSEYELASLSTVVAATTDSRPTSQVLDLYFVAIENVPGSWMHMEGMRAFAMSVVNKIEQQNPGLELRTHWVTKLSYGRNPVYRPYVNEIIDSGQNIPEAYAYPGL